MTNQRFFPSSPKILTRWTKCPHGRASSEHSERHVLCCSFLLPRGRPTRWPNGFADLFFDIKREKRLTAIPPLPAGEGRVRESYALLQVSVSLWQTRVQPTPTYWELFRPILDPLPPRVGCGGQGTNAPYQPHARQTAGSGHLNLFKLT